AAARATTRGKLARRLRGDLDAIALKALAKRPADRYSSVMSLADDVQRYLSGDPVEATSSARVNARLGKALERHPFATAPAVTLIAAAVELALQNQSVWVPALQATVDRLAAQATTIFSRWRPDEPAKRSP